MSVAKNEVPAVWKIFLNGYWNPDVLVGVRAPRRNILAPVSTSTVLDRLLGLEQPDVGNALFAKIVCM